MRQVGAIRLLLFPYRFNEWGQAVWKQQLEKLQGNGAGKPKMFFLGFPIVDEDKTDCPSLKLGSNFKGLVMQDPLLAVQTTGLGLKL